MKQLELQVALKLSGTLKGKDNSREPIHFGPTTNFSHGVGVNEANQFFLETRALTAGQSEDLNLSELTDESGNPIAFTSIKSLVVSAAATNANNVEVGGAESCHVKTLFGAEGGVAIVRPGGLLAMSAPDEKGFSIIAKTADLLKIANGKVGTSVTYTIAIVGTV
jgi:hypothetical protein